MARDLGILKKEIGLLTPQLRRPTIANSTVNQPWDRQDQEPNNWHQRFTRYRLLGAKRSLLGVYREEVARLSPERRDPPNSIPGAWREACKKWNWSDRAAAWDTEQARSHEKTVVKARSRQVEQSIALEDKFLAREAKLRAKAYEWVENYLFGRITETRTTKKTKTGDDGFSSEESTIEVPKAPPQWMIERYTGRRNYEKQFGALIDLIKELMSLEDSASVQDVKGLIQGVLESMLLEDGVDEVRSLLSHKSH